jgi:hypothetical protein
MARETKATVIKLVQEDNDLMKELVPEPEPRDDTQTHHGRA